MGYLLSAKRRQELLATLSDESGESLIRFLDSVDSLEELQLLSPSFRKHAEIGDLWLLDYYEKNLRKWPHPQLEEAFKHEFPLVSKRLDTTWKVRVFLRAVAAREVKAETMASVFEELIYRREVLKEDFLWYPQYRKNGFGTALRIVYHTQLPYTTLTELMFNLDQPTSCGHAMGAGPNGLFIDWRSEAARKASRFP